MPYVHVRGIGTRTEGKTFTHPLFPPFSTFYAIHYICAHRDLLYHHRHRPFESQVLQLS